MAAIPPVFMHFMSFSFAREGCSGHCVNQVARAVEVCASHRSFLLFGGRLLKELATQSALPVVATLIRRWIVEFGSVPPGTAQSADNAHAQSRADMLWPQ